MKRKAGNRELHSVIVSEASAWFVEFRAGDMHAAARDRFVEWLRRSPEHIQAYLEVAGAWAELPAGDPRGSIDLQALIVRAKNESEVIPVRAFQGRKRQQITSSSRRLRFAASFVLLSVLAGMVLWFQSHQKNFYVTQIGEQRSIHLTDGSLVDLNAGTKVKIRFSGDARNIELVEGEALFHVAKDPARPFVVRSENAEVRAVGTQFNVYRKKNGTVVTVLEGRVAVEPLAIKRPANGAPQSLLDAGEQLTISPHAVTQPQHIDVAIAMGWMQRRLTFDETPLGDVADEFNRYNTRRLVIDDARLRDVAISGVYSSTDPTSLINFLREQPAIGVAESKTEIRITRHDSN